MQGLGVGQVRLGLGLGLGLGLVIPEVFNRGSSISILDSGLRHYRNDELDHKTN